MKRNTKGQISFRSLLAINTIISSFIWLCIFISALPAYAQTAPQGPKIGFRKPAILQKAETLFKSEEGEQLKKDIQQEESNETTAYGADSLDIEPGTESVTPRSTPSTLNAALKRENYMRAARIAVELLKQPRPKRQKRWDNKIAPDIQAALNSAPQEADKALATLDEKIAERKWSRIDEKVAIYQQRAQVLETMHSIVLEFRKLTEEQQEGISLDWQRFSGALPKARENLAEVRKEAAEHYFKLATEEEAKAAKIKDPLKAKLAYQQSASFYKHADAYGHSEALNSYTRISELATISIALDGFRSTAGSSWDTKAEELLLAQLGELISLEFIAIHEPNSTTKPDILLQGTIITAKTQRFPTNSKTEKLSRDIEDGKGSDGKPKMKNVSATVTTYMKKATSEVSGTIKILDNRTKRVLANESFTGYWYFTNNYSTVSGDERALGKGYRSLNTEQEDYPSNETMISNALAEAMHQCGKQVKGFVDTNLK